MRGGNLPEQRSKRGRMVERHGKGSCERSGPASGSTRFDPIGAPEKTSKKLKKRGETKSRHHSFQERLQESKTKSDT